MWHVTTFAGGGSTSDADGIGPAAGFSIPYGLALAGNTLYVADLRAHALRTIDTTTAQTGTLVPFSSPSGGFRDGVGTSARFNSPRHVVTAGSTLYVADNLNHRIRAIDLASANKAVTTLAGSGTAGFADNTTGTNAQFNSPTGLAVSGNTLYVADSSNHRIRAIDLTTKAVRTIAGDGTRANTNGIGTKARLNLPFGIVASGNTLYVTAGDLIRKLEGRDL